MKPDDFRIAACMTTFAFTLVLLGQRAALAKDTYLIDPVIEANLRTVDARFSSSGDVIGVPVSHGISARLPYPPGDACPGSTILITARGTAGVGRGSIVGYKRGDELLSFTLP